jgi:hypothetical protein
LFWRLTCAGRTPRRTLLLTLASDCADHAIERKLAWLAALDWLLPMVMVTVIAIGYPIWRALLLGGGIWLVTVLTLVGLDSDRSMISDLMLVVPASSSSLAAPPSYATSSSCEARGGAGGSSKWRRSNCARA